jgi:hypothetical protein
MLIGELTINSSHTKVNLWLKRVIGGMLILKF